MNRAHSLADDEVNDSLAVQSSSRRRHSIFTDNDSTLPVQRGVICSMHIPSKSITGTPKRLVTTTQREPSELWRPALPYRYTHTLLARPFVEAFYDSASVADVADWLSRSKSLTPPQSGHTDNNFAVILPTSTRKTALLFVHELTCIQRLVYWHIV
ncbi:unnamed protein product [Mesocestoides corti]|uniref:Uncharacterized protein n=2 Tax=Mesocestoides corti TaxID=53468 RepID=A0A0R3UP21_MESCO|nr:unnamed protein product [Mesocestoides corti]